CRLPAARSFAMMATVAVLPRTGTLAAAPTVTQVIDVAGDGQGHDLDSPWGIVADSAGNVFVAAFVSNDVLRRAPDGTITAVIDASGDGLGHTQVVVRCGPHGGCVPEAERSACCPMNSWRAFAISSCPAGEM